LHTTASNWKPKLKASIEAGCKRIDGALLGYGGCPMAGDDLVGNMDTLQVISYFKEKGLSNNINESALSFASNLAQQIFIH
jgi:hydroxymethylglutaryl-CoA lyase